MSINCVVHADYYHSIATTAPPVTTCTDLIRPSNTMISYNGGSIDNRPVGTVATYSCDTGYTLYGGSTRTCSDGTWSGSAPTCESESLPRFLLAIH